VTFLDPWIRRKLPAAAAVVVVLALFIGGAQHGAGSLFTAPWDKLAHLAFYFCLTLLLAGGFRVGILASILLALSVGMLDELHQFWLPERFASLDDWLADVVGAWLAGMVLYVRKKR
jgi:VanZ family protein